MNKDKPVYYQDVEIPKHIEEAIRAITKDGFIGCAKARALAEELGCDTHFIGYALDKLDIKVDGCALGCF